jgi:PIN domain nuclease of toxin-antitoxin system
MLTGSDASLAFSVSCWEVAKLVEYGRLQLHGQ